MSMLGTVLAFVRALPSRPAELLSCLVTIAYLALRSDYRREIRANYRLVMGRDRAWFWVRNGWAVGRNLALMARVGRPDTDAIIDRPMIYADNITGSTLERDLHTIVVSFHFGLWEYLPQVFARQGHSVALVAGKQKNPHVSRQVNALRRTGNVSLTGLKQALARLSRPGLTGFMLDNTSQGEHTCVCAHGLTWRMPAVSFRLARSRKIKLRPAFCRRERGLLRVDLGQPGDERSVVAALLDQVHRYPEQWVFWAKAQALQPAEPRAGAA